MQSSELSNTNSISILSKWVQVKKIGIKKSKNLNSQLDLFAGSYSEPYEDKRATAAPLAQMIFLKKWKIEYKWTITLRQL